MNLRVIFLIVFILSPLGSGASTENDEPQVVASASATERVLSDTAVVCSLSSLIYTPLTD
jgi:hypothetical protein